MQERCCTQVLAEPPVADWPDERTDASLTTVLRVEGTLVGGGTEGNCVVEESLMSTVLPIGANRKTDNPEKSCID